MRWPAYLRGVLAFSAVSVLFLYLLQRLQGSLPGSLGFSSIDPDQAFNTAASFVSNTNWQSYYGEQAMGHVVQTGGLAVQNFVSAAVGIAVAVALVRGFARARTGELGNFWADLVRGTVRILLPIAVIGAIVLVACGAIQNFAGIHEVGQFMGGTQQWNGGAVASQEAIKELGTNGGGYFNANSAHPFENPNGLSNLFEIFLILLIPFALTRTFGRMVGSRQAGLRDPRDDGDHLDRLHRADDVDRVRPPRPGVRHRGRCDGGQGDPLRHRRLVDLRGGHDADLDRRGQLLPLLVHRAAAAVSPCWACSWARSRPAVSAPASTAC